MKRKKKLEKGIESIKKQIEIHKEKREKALEESELELAEYYEHEIDNLEKNQEKKKQQLDKQ